MEFQTETETAIAVRTCLNCNEPVKGRIDKKFCDDQCRTSYNNRQNSEDAAMIRHVNQTLRRNRRVLSQLLISEPEGKAKISGKRLREAGFQFSYHTHLYTTRTGSVYYFCYEYGYLPLENELYMVVKREKS
jgi:hypothetical protein